MFSTHLDPSTYAVCGTCARARAHTALCSCLSTVVSPRAALVAAARSTYPRVIGVGRWPILIRLGWTHGSLRPRKCRDVAVSCSSSSALCFKCRGSRRHATPRDEDVEAMGRVRFPGGFMPFLPGRRGVADAPVLHERCSDPFLSRSPPPDPRRPMYGRKRLVFETRMSLPPAVRWCRSGPGRRRLGERALEPLGHLLRQGERGGRDGSRLLKQLVGLGRHLLGEVGRHIVVRV